MVIMVYYSISKILNFVLNIIKKIVVDFVQNFYYMFYKWIFECLVVVWSLMMFFFNMFYGYLVFDDDVIFLYVCVILFIEILYGCVL